jgi:ABC-type glycerol-3-phosphate transport system permease component
MSRASGKVAHYVLVRLVLVLAVLWIVPVWLAIVAGTKTEAEYATTGLFEFGTSVEWINFGMFFVEPFNFGLNILNSLTSLVSQLNLFHLSISTSSARHVQVSDFKLVYKQMNQLYRGSESLIN